MIYQFTTFEPPLGVQPGASTPNCFEYSATNRCQPANFMASTPAMAPIGLPTRNRSRTSTQMSQPAAQPKIPMKTNKKEKLQNATGFAFDDGFHDQLPTAILPICPDPAAVFSPDTPLRLPPLAPLQRRRRHIQLPPSQAGRSFIMH